MAIVTRTYSDLDATFGANPVTGDLSLKRDAAAIKFAVKNLVLTRNFERPFQSSIGSQIYRLLFEPMDDVTEIVLRRAIAQTLENHEPRIKVVDIKLNFDDDHNGVIVEISFIIINTQLPITLSIALDRSR